MRQLASHWLIIPVVLLLALLFIGSPIDDSYPLYRQIWNSGHFFLFGGLVYLLCQLPWTKRQKPIYTLFGVLIFSIVFGLVTELIQRLIGRSFSINDMLLDLLGALAGFCIAMISRFHSLPQNIGLLAFSLLFTFLGLSPLFTALYQEWQIFNSLPILADFEQPEEERRWQYSNVDIAIVAEHASHKLNAMQVTFHPANYPTLNFTHFYRDWQNFDALAFDLYNPAKTQVALVVKIFDGQHPAHRFRFNDRFNRQLVLAPGKNAISIDMQAIRQSPASRDMDLSNIQSLSFFMTRANQPTIIYLDHIRLE